MDKVVKEVKNPLHSLQIMNAIGCGIKIERHILEFFVQNMLEKVKNLSDKERVLRLFL